MSLLFAITNVLLFIVAIVIFGWILVKNIELSLVKFIVLSLIAVVCIVLLFVNIKNFKQIQYTAPQYNIDQMKLDFAPRTVYVDYDPVFLSEVSAPGTLEETVYFGHSDWIYYEDIENRPEPKPSPIPRPEYLMEN